MKRKLGFLFTSIFLISLGVLVVIISNTRADQNLLAKVAFFVFAWTVVTSAIILVSLTYNSIRHKQIKKEALKNLSRRAVLISSALVGIVVFSALHVLNFLSVLTYIFSIILIEFFFVARRVERINEI